MNRNIQQCHLSCLKARTGLGPDDLHNVSTAAVFTLTPLMAAGLGWVIVRQTTSLGTLAVITLGGIGSLWL